MHKLEGPARFAEKVAEEECFPLTNVRFCFVIQDVSESEQEWPEEMFGARKKQPGRAVLP